MGWDLGLGVMTGWVEGEGPSGMMGDIGTREGESMVGDVSGGDFTTGL